MKFCTNVHVICVFVSTCVKNRMKQIMSSIYLKICHDSFWHCVSSVLTNWNWQNSESFSFDSSISHTSYQLLLCSLKNAFCKRLLIFCFAVSFVCWKNVAKQNVALVWQVEVVHWSLFFGAQMQGPNLDESCWSTE